MSKFVDKFKGILKGDLKVPLKGTLSEAKKTKKKYFGSKPPIKRPNVGGPDPEAEQRLGRKKAAERKGSKISNVLTSDDLG